FFPSVGGFIANTISRINLLRHFFHFFSLQLQHLRCVNCIHNRSNACRWIVPMNPDMLRKLPYWHPNCFASIKRLVHMLATVLHSGKKTKVYTEQKVSYLFDT